MVEKEGYVQVLDHLSAFMFDGALTLPLRISH